MSEIIPARCKFAVLALETNRVAEAMPATVQLSDNLFVLRQLPVDLPQHWTEWLGTLLVNRLQANGLYLLSFAASTRLDILDDENEALRKSVHGLYWSLLLSIEFLFHDRGLLFTGSRYDDKYDVRSSEEYTRLPFVPYAAWGLLNEDAVRRAHELSGKITDLLKVAQFERLGRGNATFYEGVQDSYFGSRVLQFVRTVEALILPPVGSARDAFIKRGRLFVGAGQDDALGQMYDIRSAVVHLHEPTALLPRTTDRLRAMALLKRCIQSEALARYCLAHLSRRSEVHRFFQDNQTLEAFWKLDEPARAKLWGDQLDLNVSLADLREDWVDDEILGLK